MKKKNSYTDKILFVLQQRQTDRQTDRRTERQRDRELFRLKHNAERKRDKATLPLFSM